MQRFKNVLFFVALGAERIAALESAYVLTTAETGVSEI